MVVLIDVGNSFVKVAYSTNGEISRISSFPTNSVRRDPFLIKEVVSSNDFKDVVVCSVVDSITEILKKELPEALFISSRLNLPLKFDYNLEQIGADRIANASAACIEHGDDVVVVSIGTAVCVDVVREKVFKGGAIFPGFHLMFSSLSEGTSAIPLVTLDEIPPGFPGRDSQECVRAGVFYSVLGGIRQVLGQVEGSCSVVLTGGDAEILKDSLDFAIYDSDLTFKGMIAIYKLNR